jgi:hypothetical protein
MLLEAETNKYCPGGNDFGAISNLITWVLNFFFDCGIDIIAEAGIQYLSCTGLTEKAKLCQSLYKIPSKHFSGIKMQEQPVENCTVYKYRVKKESIGFLNGYLESRKKNGHTFCTVYTRCACYCLTIQPWLTVCEAPCILTVHGQIPSVAQDIGLSGWL